MALCGFVATKTSEQKSVSQIHIEC